MSISRSCNKIKTEIHKSQLENSERWVRSIGKKGLSITHTHYRNGRLHAVFRRNSNWGELHKDKEAPHSKPLRHLLRDAPEVLATGAMAATGLAIMKSLKSRK